MNEEIKQLWLDALEDPNTRQATGALCVIDDDGQKSFCCLGVLSQIAADSGIVSETDPMDVGPYDNGQATPVGYINKYFTPGDVEYGILPKDVIEWSEMPDVNPIVTISRQNVIDWGRIDLLDRFSLNADLGEELSMSLAECNDVLKLNLKQIADLIRDQL